MTRITSKNNKRLRMPTMPGPNHRPEDMDLLYPRSRTNPGYQHHSLDHREYKRGMRKRLMRRQRSQGWRPGR